MSSKFICECCKYHTDKQSNYNRHLKTAKHIKNISAQNTKSNGCHKKSKKDTKKELYICDACDKLFSDKSNLHRHKKNCTDAKYKIKIELMQNEIQNLKNIIKEKNKAEKLYKKFIDSNNKAIDTVKESVKKGGKSVYNVVINTIKKPIPLKKIEDVKQIHSAYKDDEMEEFVRDLCSMQQGGSLYKFIGNFIIKQYKKDDITKQSMFSTDSSRSNFIYSTLDKNNKAVWKKDPRGLNVGSITLDNILMYIQDIIGEQQLKMVKRMPQMSELEILKLSDVVSTCNKIDRLIRHNNGLKNKIVAYLSSNFGFDERELLLGNV